jgi:hypothetical protein
MGSRTQKADHWVRSLEKMIKRVVHSAMSSVQVIYLVSRMALRLEQKIHSADPMEL